MYLALFSFYKSCTKSSKTFVVALQVLYAETTMTIQKVKCNAYSLHLLDSPLNFHILLFILHTS